MRNPIFQALLMFAVAGCSGGGGSDSGTGGTDTIVTPADLDLVTSSAAPSKRSEILAGVHPQTNSILIFGGNDGPIVDQFPQPKFLNDTWIFEPGAGWTEVAGEGPKRRGRYSLSIDEEGNRALLFGGRFRQQDVGGDYTLYNDLWAFDYLTRTWTEIDTGPGKPPPRYYPASAWVPSEKALYLWGGLTNTDPLVFEVSNDLWRWSEADGWEQLQPSGNEPSQRGFFGSTYDSARNEIVVFGGQIGNLSSLAYNDMYALSLDTLEWRLVHNGERGKAPTTRMHAHLTYDEASDRYLLFGGHTDEGDQNDLWWMDPEERDWNELYYADEITGTRFGCLGNDSEVPADYVVMDLAAPERRHRGMYALMYGNLWVFGGIHSECSDHLDDTWRFDLGTETWHELIEATAGESCLRRGDDCDCLCI